MKIFKKLTESATPTFGSLEGYIASRIFVKALKNVQGQPTRENIIDALEGLKTFDMGLEKPLHLTVKKHQASHRVWPTILRTGQFVPYKWKDISKVLKPGK